MKFRGTSSTDYPITFLLVSSSDHITGETGLTPTVAISKNGGAFAAPAGAVTEIGYGWYALAGNATDRDTNGELLIHAEGTGADPVDERYLISPDLATAAALAEADDAVTDIWAVTAGDAVADDATEPTTVTYANQAGDDQVTHTLTATTRTKA